jgi:hypothetical protein
MSHRLQILVPEKLDQRIRLAARRERLSKGEWVRRAVERELSARQPSSGKADPVGRLSSLKAPTANLDRMLAEIEAGRR